MAGTILYNEDMPRPLRIEYPGACYHVMNRGAAYRPIYQSPGDREQFLELLDEVHDMFRVQVYAYCLMTNHYHLLLHTPLPNLSRTMRHINGVYTKRFNKQKNIDGALFRGRYKAILIQEDPYLLQVSRYIHRNPVEAGMVNEAEKFPWSSYQYYLHDAKTPRYIDTCKILGMIGGNAKKRRYQSFVEEGLDKENKIFYNVENPPAIMGKKNYKGNLLKARDDEYRVAVKSDYNRTCELPSIEDILELVAQYYKVDRSSLLKIRRGRGNNPKMLAVYICRKLSGAKIGDIA